MCFKKHSLKIAYEQGVRRCPCCNVQLVWKANTEKQQRNLATVDHIIPRSTGGADSSDNMFVMCRVCNGKRGIQCFVHFVTSRGIDKEYAEDLYRRAHVVSLQNMIANQFTQVYGNDRKEIVKSNKRKRKQLKEIIQNYVSYFGDYLPEFELLEKLVSKG